MGQSLRFFYGTEEQILELTPDDPKWFDRAFYFPENKSYFYQALNGELKIYGQGDPALTGIGITLNGLLISGIKTFIEDDDVLIIPINYDYNTFSLKVDGTITCDGQINMM